MAHRTVREAMTARVATATEDASFKIPAEILAEHHISAVPVLDARGRVAGVVSEIDLLRKEEYQEDAGAPAPPRWRHRADRSRAAGLTARGSDDIARGDHQPGCERGRSGQGT